MYRILLKMANNSENNLVLMAVPCFFALFFFLLSTPVNIEEMLLKFCFISEHSTAHPTHAHSMHGRLVRSQIVDSIEHFLTHFTTKLTSGMEALNVSL